MKKARNLAAILVSAMLCYWGGVLAGCDNNAGSLRPSNIHNENNNTGTNGDGNTDSVETGGNANEYVKDDVYASDFYETQYLMDYVRDVFRSPSIPSASDKSLTVYIPSNPYCPDYGYQYSNSELANIKYFVLEKSSKTDRYDEYAVSKDGEKEKIGTGGRIMCFGKEGFLYLCGGSSGTYYGTFFFTKYGYDKFKNGNYNMTYEFSKLNLGHNDIAEIFGSAN